ncbi:FGGY-family carbohydrate kinase [Rhizobium oryziradicis]|uniref:Carbohydrate kinase n=1 Tax=Rhizobium oryziradicis TaxID=1867956 RepID=A0A1Q8ZKV0_9HYPH|nr:FGGY-family carbohydrate kinase [Rhizobium oryziradicis]OLP42370.1 carbohydrate kinase [Rhizobium oryziradicis]
MTAQYQRPRYKRIAVIDIGKTNAKVVVIDAVSGSELAGQRTANTVITDGPYPHFDTERLWFFIIDALRQLAQTPGFDAISITTHGACAALLNGEGGLALPVLDYEHPYSDDVQKAYQALRPDFNETCSPLLPCGLNLGAQLHYQKAVFASEFAKVKTILTYPQYWAFRLTGVAANEVTSLGCHTDLWNPASRQYSQLVEKLGLLEKMAPVRAAFDVLGPLKREIADQLGLKEPVSVYCGIHDSNASLLPQLMRRKAPFSVVSTGTWIISFAVGCKTEALDPRRDTLANVDVFGKPVPSARYMGGREFEILTKGLSEPADDCLDVAVNEVIANDVMLLPNVVAGSGPFPRQTTRWINEPADSAQRYVAILLYVALMTASSLAIVDADGPIVVEGPFAKNRIYLRALASITGRNVHVGQGGTPTGTAEGAALLTGISVPEVHDTIIPAGLIDTLRYQQDFLERVGNSAHFAR